MRRFTIINKNNILKYNDHLIFNFISVVRFDVLESTTASMEI